MPMINLKEWHSSLTVLDPSSIQPEVKNLDQLAIFVNPIVKPNRKMNHHADVTGLPLMRIQSSFHAGCSGSAIPSRHALLWKTLHRVSPVACSLQRMA